MYILIPIDIFNNIAVYRINRYLMKHDNNREEKGKEIALNSNQQVIRLSDHLYKVRSQTTKREYDVISTESGWICTCPDHVYRHICCKHIHAVEFSIRLREQVRKENAVTIEQLNVSICPNCNSNKIVKHGIRHNDNYDIQRWFCNECKRWFSFNIGFEKMRVSPQAITSAMQLYFTGESLRSVQKFLRLQGVNVSHQTVYKWIKKYTKLMENYLSKLTPQVGDTWRADEIWVKVKGDMKYLFALMDDETRFWIAREVADTKEKHDATGLFRQAKQITGTKPKVIITDGLKSYNDAYKKEFWTQQNPRTVHLRNITLQGQKNNNKMERLNGEIRDREKVVRGLKKDDSVLIVGSQIYHNYIRPHMSLDGKTPSEVCGIKIEGDDKWKTLIQNASMSRPFTRRTVSH
jgi:transposase-like protein